MSTRNIVYFSDNGYKNVMTIQTVWNDPNCRNDNYESNKPFPFLRMNNKLTGCPITTGNYCCNKFVSPGFLVCHFHRFHARCTKCFQMITTNDISKSQFNHLYLETFEHILCNECKKTNRLH